jgi:hypothetical protein
MPKEGEIVTAKNYSGQAFKIIDLQGEFAMIQRFNVSRRDSWRSDIDSADRRHSSVP